MRIVNVRVIMNVRSLLLFSALFLSAVAVPAQNDITKIDFQNYTYQPYCAGEEPQKVTVKSGEFSDEKQVDGYTDRFFFKIYDTTLGDLNGDGAKEAVILSVCNTGGTGNFTEGFIYTMRSGKPVMLARIQGGDRAHGGIRSAVVVNGLLVVDSNDAGEEGGACCPEYVIKSTYKLVNGKLIEQGKPVRRELYPKEPLKFAKGASSAMLKVTVQAQDRKRFTLGARAGQVMTVKVNSEKVSVRLLEDALVTEGANSFTAKLQKNGTYTIELSNYEEVPVVVTLSVGIK
jgi:hypothetical protein